MDNVEVLECQKAMLIDMVESHFLQMLKKGKPYGDHIIPSETWKNITAILNDMGPSCKDADGWMKFFDKLKSKSKSKVMAQRHYLNNTGGGPPSTVKMNDLELRILSMYGKNNFDGLQNVGECGFLGRKFTVNPSLNNIADTPLQAINSGSKTSQKMRGTKRLGSALQAQVARKKLN